MKKLLAVVLCLAMLLSCFAVGVSAATREVTQDESTQNKFWQFPAGNSYNPVEVGAQDTFDVEMDIRIDDAAGRLFTGWASLATAPYFAADGVGVGTDAKIAGTYALNTWYHVKWDNLGDGTTDIYVDGAKVGNVAAVATLYDGTQAFWQWDKISIDNLVVGTYSNDMEVKLNDGQGQSVLEEIPGAIHNNLKWEVTSSNKYLHYGEDNAYIYATGMPVGASDGFTRFSVDVRLLTSDSAINPYFGNNMKLNATSVGIGGSTLPYNFEVGKWYNIMYVCYNMNAASFVYVDGVVVGEGIVQGIIQTDWCGGGIMVDMDNMKIEKSANLDAFEVVYADDFEDGVWNAQNSDGNGFVASGVSVFDKSPVYADLGLKYWQFPAGNSYNPVEVGAQDAAFDVQMDIKLDDAAGRLYTGWAGLAIAPYFAADGVGVGTDAKIAGTYALDTWYRVKWDNLGNGTTDIYVDGAFVGNVAATASLYDGTQAFWQWDKISIDNLVVGAYSNDMEVKLNDGQGQSVAYDLTVAGSSIFDHFETTAPAGDATLIEIGTNPTAEELKDRFDCYAENAYIDIGGINPGGKDYILNFDLALIPNNTSEDGHWLELWTNTASRRFKVGTTFTGRDADLTQFDWGEATINNFHNVTFVMKGSYDIAQIYVDKTLVYEGSSGKVWEDRFIGMLWNCSAVIDNIQLMDLDYNQKGASVSDYGNMAAKPRTINLDAENFCETNGHINGGTTRTTQPTCYSLGVDSVTCGTCGEIYATYDVAMVAHNWAQYDINRKTEDGLVYSYCKNDGCVERRYVELPAADAYTGTLNAFYDMQDDFLKAVYPEFGDTGFFYEDGVAKITEASYKGNYNIIDIDAWTNTSVKTNNWSTSFDIVYTGAFDGPDCLKPDGSLKYGHTFHWWFGGSNGITAAAGYNDDSHTLYIEPGPYNKGDFEAVTVPFAFVIGESYNIELKFTQDMGTAYACGAIYINGKEMVKYDAEDEAIFYIGYESDNMDNLYFRNFGSSFIMDNYVVGSYDFAWARVYDGDVDGDYALTNNDALLMRKYLAKVLADADIVTSRADANGDAVVNALDQLEIRIALATTPVEPEAPAETETTVA